MIRKLVLAMTILALAAVPLPAWAARDNGHDGRHEMRENHERFRGHERFEHGPFVGFGFYPSPYYAYAPPTSNSGCRGNGFARRASDPRNVHNSYTSDPLRRRCARCAI